MPAPIIPAAENAWATRRCRKTSRWTGSPVLSTANIRYTNLGRRLAIVHRRPPAVDNGGRYARRCRPCPALAATTSRVSISPRGRRSWLISVVARDGCQTSRAGRRSFTLAAWPLAVALELGGRLIPFPSGGGQFDARWPACCRHQSPVDRACRRSRPLVA
jgi:hypothetical protein